MQTVLVAGGAGFIGSNLCDFLLKKNYKVICIDNFITSEKDNISDLLENPNFSFLEQDTIYLNSSEIPHVDFIFHMASPASPNANSSRSYIAYPIETLLVNSQGTYNLLELAKRDSAKLLFASTSEIYGDPAVSPQPESYFGNVNPNGVRSVYDEAKRFGEAIVMAYFRKFETDARIVRIFNTYGPKMREDDGRVVSNFISQALSNSPITIYGEGQQTRSFCFISDMLEGLSSAMFNPNTKGEVINLGNPDERTIKEIADIIKNLTGSSSEIINVPLPPDDPKERKPDISKAKSLLSWEPRIGLSEGLEKTVEYFKSI